MKISEWLYEQAAQGIDVSRIKVPSEMSYDDAPDERLYFKEHKSCGYFCKGQDRKAGIHSARMMWHLFTRDKALALRTAREHIE